ncbi:MAG: hypothetical protein JWP52_4419 [Rhizobacter sp.]|nr:hypothetical protein [Rhizobacter sp.]
MKWLFDPGIRMRLRLLVLMLAIPFLIYVGLTAMRQANDEREQASQRMLTAAEVTGMRLDDHVANIEQMLKVLSHVVGVSPGDTATNDAMLAGLASSIPHHINDISVWTPAGANIGSLNRGQSGKSVGVKRSPGFLAALRRGELAVSAPLVSPINGEAIGVFAVAVRRHGQVVAVLSASTRLRKLEELLAPSTGLPEGVVITVSDSDGILLARSIDPDRWIGADVSRQQYFLEASARHRGTGESPGPDGVMRMGGFETTRRLPWLVYVAAPSSEVLFGVRHRTTETLVAGGLMLLLGLFMASSFGERISRPLRSLSADAEAIGKGDLTRRIKVEAGGEIGVLACTFNQMAAALQDRTASLAQSESQLRAITDNLPAMVSYIDADQRFRFANRAFQDWLEVDPAALIGRSLAEQYSAPAYAEMSPHVARAMDGQRVVYERRVDTRNGAIFLQTTLVPDLSGDGAVQGLYALIHDVTERRHNEERLRSLAESDLLTGLPNRRLFLARLGEALARAAQASQPMALLFLDVDHFKRVNDLLGHAAGDELLVEVARRLVDAVRPSDTAARLSGDEFTVILEPLIGVDEAIEWTEKIVGAMRAPMWLQGLHGADVAVTASIGVAMSTPGDHDGADLLRRADAALYEAKRRGRDGYWVDAKAQPAERPRAVVSI